MYADEQRRVHASACRCSSFKWIKYYRVSSSSSSPSPFVPIWKIVYLYLNYNLIFYYSTLFGAQTHTTHYAHNRRLPPPLPLHSLHIIIISVALIHTDRRFVYICYALTHTHTCHTAIVNMTNANAQHCIWIRSCRNQPTTVLHLSIQTPHAHRTQRM